MRYEPFCSTEIVFTRQEVLSERLFSDVSKSSVLLMSRSAVERWVYTSLVAEMAERSLKNGVFFRHVDKIQSNPTVKDLADVLNVLNGQQIEKIIAIGGGSVIDLAKAIKAFYSPVRDIVYETENLLISIHQKKYFPNREIDIVAVPSTAGTGSEVTQWATIWSDDATKKYSIDYPELKPDLALIVPELTLSMSPKITLSTGLDAFCHAMEAYWSKHTSLLVQELAYRAMELIFQNLPKAVQSGEDRIAREKMCQAAVLAGLAFSKTRTTACHSISYPLTMKYQIPHGIAVAITADAVSQFNRGSFPNSEDLFRLFDRYGGLKNFMEEVSQGVASLRLSEYGVTAEDIDHLVETSFTAGRMDNNPVELTSKDVFSVLCQIL